MHSSIGGHSWSATPACILKENDLHASNNGAASYCKSLQMLPVTCFCATPPHQKCKPAGFYFILKHCERARFFRLVLNGIDAAAELYTALDDLHMDKPLAQLKELEVQDDNEFFGGTFALDRLLCAVPDAAPNSKVRHAIGAYSSTALPGCSLTRDGCELMCIMQGGACKVGLNNLHQGAYCYTQGHTWIAHGSRSSWQGVYSKIYLLIIV